MRTKILLLAVLAIPLAACSEADVKTVQDAAVKTCGYLPTAQTVTGIASALYTPGAIYFNAAEAIAGKICTAVTTNPLADGPGASTHYTPTVAGVVVRGRFVQ